MHALDTLPETWAKVADAEARRLEAELKREVCSLHPLFGLTVVCIARREGRDDFLFSLPTHSKPLAVIHLTWSKEKTTDFPWTTLFESAEDFTANWKRIFE
jgi:hypothetical protein